MSVGWTKCFDVNGLPTYRRCPPTTPTCQPFKTLPRGFKGNLTLPVSTEALASIERNTHQDQLKLMLMPCPKQHLLCPRPQAHLKLPKLRRCEVPCQKPKEAPREGTKSTAMPLAIQGAPLTPLHSTSTCLKESIIRLVHQEAATSRPKQTNCGVLGAPNMASPTIIQQPTALS